MVQKSRRVGPVAKRMGARSLAVWRDNLLTLSMNRRTKLVRPANQAGGGIGPHRGSFRMASQPASISVMSVASHREKVTTFEVGKGFSHSFATGRLEAGEEVGLEFRGVHGYKYEGSMGFFHLRSIILILQVPSAGLVSQHTPNHRHIPSFSGILLNKTYLYLKCILPRH